MTDHNDTGATARLWKIDPRPFRNHGLIHISNGEYIVAKALGQTVTCETEAEATAALIVEAVNAYEPLKARLAEVERERDRSRDCHEETAQTLHSYIRLHAAAEARVAELERDEKFWRNEAAISDVKLTLARDRIAVLEKALAATLDQYISLASSGDCGFWDADKEPHVIAARAALAAKQKEAGK